MPEKIMTIGDLEKPNLSEEELHKMMDEMSPPLSRAELMADVHAKSCNLYNALSDVLSPARKDFDHDSDLVAEAKRIQDNLSEIIALIEGADEDE